MNQNNTAQCAVQYCAAEHLVAALIMKGTAEVHWPCIQPMCISNQQAEQIANRSPSPR